MTPELTLLSNLVGSRFVFTLAFIIGVMALYRAVVKGETMAWVVVAICSVIAAFPQIFNAVRTTGYEIIAPLAPSGSSSQQVPFTSGASSTSTTPADSSSGGTTYTTGGGF